MTDQRLLTIKQQLLNQLQEWVGNYPPADGAEDNFRLEAMREEIDQISSIQEVKMYLESQGVNANQYLATVDYEFEDQVIDESDHAELVEYLPVSQKVELKNHEQNSTRAVLVIVKDWPSGTMAMKFGSALRSSLGASKEQMQMLQFSPERIFRVETNVSEIDFRSRLNDSEKFFDRLVLYFEL